MQAARTATVPPEAAAPLADFTRCHLGIVSQLEASAGLPGLVAAAERGREVAAATVDLFTRVVQPHHAEEEAELFPAVMRSALPEEKETVRRLVEQLTAEHREIEAQWKLLEASVKKVARGQPALVDEGLLASMIASYLRHARMEESQFLPLAETILRRNGNHMAALDLALHLRHVPQPVGYI